MDINLYILFSYIYHELKRSYDQRTKANQMEIFILLCASILAIFFIVKKVFSSAKINLFKDQAAWSGKDINIRHRKSREISEITGSNNYLNIIAEESKVYLQDQSSQDAE